MRPDGGDTERFARLFGNRHGLADTDHQRLTAGREPFLQLRQGLGDEGPLSLGVVGQCP
ncbi:MAG: hypothetical protein AAF460_14545 [Pseudomonadota bacterium]